jgi:hypothetical protein
MILTEIHGMTALERMRLLLSTDFSNANSFLHDFHALEPVTSAPMDHVCRFDQHLGVEDLRPNSVEPRSKEPVGGEEPPLTRALPPQDGQLMPRGDELDFQ